MSLLFPKREARAAGGMTFPEPVIPPYPGAFTSSASSSVGSNPDGALAVPTVWACVALLSNAVSMLPLEAFRRTAGVPERIAEPALLVSPAANMTQSEWLHMLMVSLLLRGNAYGLIVERDSQQRPRQIELLSPDALRVEVDRETGRLTYTMNGNSKDVTANIWHVRGMTMPGSRVGLSPISYAAATLGIDLASRQFATDFFTGGGIPKAVVTSDQNVNQEQARTIKDRLLASTRARDPIVLGRGLTYMPISVKPEESQFLATMNANVGQIARFFTVPAGMVGGSEGGSLTYTNVEQRGIDFLTYSVQFWLKRIEDAFFPLLPQPQFVRFNAEALLRTDAETQAKVDNQRLAGKILTPSEIRHRMGLAPMTTAQQTEAGMVPLDVTPGGGAKALMAPAAAPGEPQMNSAPDVTIHNHVAPADVSILSPIDVHPAAVRQQINVAPAEVRLEQPITVQPAAAPDVRMVTVGSDPKPQQQARSRRVERDQHGDIVRIVEE